MTLQSEEWRIRPISIKITVDDEFKKAWSESSLCHSISLKWRLLVRNIACRHKRTCNLAGIWILLQEKYLHHQNGRRAKERDSRNNWSSHKELKVRNLFHWISLILLFPSLPLYCSLCEVYSKQLAKKVVERIPSSKNHGLYKNLPKLESMELMSVSQKLLQCPRSAESINLELTVFWEELKVARSPCSEGRRIL